MFKKKKMKYPGLYTLTGLRTMNDCKTYCDGEGWVPARPLGYPSLRNRIRIAWMVFTGKADAIVWPGNQ
ncbi:MAG: hypothetical protein CL678_15540 [Bdellovibrionaceae bacterium]|nr:hypothetical protein [Pseudobdellovibrionaceae bacterium]